VKPGCRMLAAVVAAAVIIAFATSAMLWLVSSISEATPPQTWHGEVSVKVAKQAAALVLVAVIVLALLLLLDRPRAV